MDDVEKAELADVFEKAAEYIEQNGWFAQGPSPELSDNSIGSACFAVAIDKVQRSMLDEAIAFATDVLELEPRGTVGAIFAWNDANTKEGVINTLQALANKLR